MGHSKIYLGVPLAHERALERALRCDLDRLHMLGQRVAWGILMGTRVGFDLDKEAARLRSEMAEQPAAQVALAFICAFQGRHDDARTHLQKAQELLTEDHPWRFLVPSEARWNARPGPHLEEVEKDRVYRVTSPNYSETNPFGNLGVATFIRLRSGALVCINPVDMHALAPQLRELGDVTHILAPAKYHHEHIPQAVALFPRAKVYGVPSQRDYPNASQIRFDGYLDEAQPLFPREIEQINIQGVDVGDTWFIDCASATLLVTDALFLPLSVAGDDRFGTPFAVFYNWAWGTGDRVCLPSYQPAMWMDLPAYQASLRRALERDFRFVGSSHGRWHAVGPDARTTLRESLSWVLELGRFGGLTHLWDFVRRHPGAFARFVKEQIQARKS